MRIWLDISGIENLQQALRRVKPRYVADGVHYGIHQEYGTSRQAGKPFMRPAVEEVRDKLPNEIKSTGLRQLDAIMGKIATDVHAVAAREAPVDTGALRNSLHVTDQEP